MNYNRTKYLYLIYLYIFLTSQILVYLPFKFDLNNLFKKELICAAGNNDWYNSIQIFYGRTIKHIEN